MKNPTKYMCVCGKPSHTELQCTNLTVTGKRETKQNCWCQGMGINRTYSSVLDIQVSVLKKHELKDGTHPHSPFQFRAPRTSLPRGSLTSCPSLERLRQSSPGSAGDCRFGWGVCLSLAPVAVIEGISNCI